MCAYASVVTWYAQAQLDYSVDSDDEWEEEDPGESISNSEVTMTAYMLTCNYGVLLYIIIIMVYFYTYRCTYHVLT